MKDRFGRTIDYLRLSITDRCNLRCGYCMPHGCKWLPMEEILTFEELEALCALAATLGIRKIKVTGGEPLVRRGCVELVGRLKGLSGIEQVTLTTNGVLLGEQALALRDAGLDAVNVSLDTLNGEIYQIITGKDCLSDTLSGIDAALAAGLPTKVNAVLQEGVNDHEWSELIELGRFRPLDVRFIEMMPIGHGKQAKGVSNSTLLEQMKDKYPALEQDGRTHGNGPARYYKIGGFQGSVGLISAIHGKFCSRCNRVRLTSTGFLKGCLCYEAGADLREPLRLGDMETVRGRMAQVMESKPQGHCFEQESSITERQEMSKIGG